MPKVDWCATCWMCVEGNDSERLEDASGCALPTFG